MHDLAMFCEASAMARTVEGLINGVPLYHASEVGADSSELVLGPILIYICCNLRE